MHVYRPAPKYDTSCAKMNPAAKIPIVDLSAFFTDGEEDAKRVAKEVIIGACVEYGFFQVVNHGIPLDLMSRAMDLCRTFFSLPDDEKLKSRPRPDPPIPAGYVKQPERSADKNEYVMMLPPGNTFNVLPSNPPGFRKATEEVFNHFQKTADLIESILNDCLGLPPNFLKEFNQERSLDLMTWKHYFPATETENVGIARHEDMNVITFVFQDDVGGLEILKDGQWIPVVPSHGTLAVNIGDSIQVLTNKKYKSATHRVTRQKGRDRYSFSFFYNLPGDKWVEPLPQFTTQIGEAPKYRGFLYKDYLALRVRNKTHPPAKPEDEVNITYYEVSTE